MKEFMKIILEAIHEELSGVDASRYISEEIRREIVERI